MARPRIIIADTDVNYILSLQLKFIEEFFEKIDLEIITDRNYFENMFESPQRAEVLIVSEDLYDLSIQKHNIGNVFLMTEKNEEEQTADLNVTRIFKYTSIKEIFNEILGKSADKLKVDISSRQETQIVVVTSATGGVGKTTVAMGICASLSKNFKKVLYINVHIVIRDVTIATIKFIFSCISLSLSIFIDCPFFSITVYVSSVVLHFFISHFL